MIKKIIFDVDNTLIEWKKEYYFKSIIYACEKYNVNYTLELQKGIEKAMNYYTDEEEYFNIEKMNNIINKKVKKHISTEFLIEVLKQMGKCVPNKTEQELIETLEYLSGKYNLVVLTNWFREYQVSRLEKMGICKYFKEIYATEEIKSKPNKEAFITACGDCKPEECIMIGDNYVVDIEGAVNAGLNAIFLNSRNKPNINKYKEIKKLQELKNIL